jgi:tetratricopeptide (TPR) repeat protein
MLAILDGDLDGAVALAERLAALGEELGSPAAGWLLAARLGSNAFFYLGQSARAVPWYDRVFELAGTGIGGDTLNRDVCAAYAGPGPEVVEALRGHLQASGARAFIPAGLEAAVLVGDRDAAARLLSLLEEYAALPTFVFMDYLSVGRRLGAAAALLGDRQRALVFYETALAAAEGVHHRPEQALIRLEIAELLLGDRLTPILSQPEGEEGRAEARRHLEVAIPELRAMKMQSYLESALHLRGRLMA